jgi:hypothetical protein
LLIAIESKLNFLEAIAEGSGAEDSGAEGSSAEDSGAEGSSAAKVVAKSKVTALYCTVSNVLLI